MDMTTSQTTTTATSSRPITRRLRRWRRLACSMIASVSCGASAVVTRSLVFMRGLLRHLPDDLDQFLEVEPVPASDLG